jgi:hypothetical protein
MPVNPITLDKIDSTIIKNVEHKVVDRIVHEIKGTEINKDNQKNENNSFNQQKQEHAARQFGLYLSKYGIKFQYKMLKNKVKVAIRDKNDRMLLDTELDDIEELLKRMQKETGSIIDLKG